MMKTKRKQRGQYSQPDSPVKRDSRGIKLGKFVLLAFDSNTEYVRMNSST